jgi:hypothetical protein
MKEDPMRKIAQRHSSKLAATLSLLALAFATVPAQAEEQRVAALSRPAATVPGFAMNTPAVAAEAKAVKQTAKAAAVKPAAKADAKDIYERDLWRHQGAG